MNQFPKEKLLNLDDEAFKSLIMEISSLAGGNPQNAKRLAADIPSLKSKISKMSDRDAQKLLDRIEDEKANEILRKLGKI